MFKNMLLGNQNNLFFSEDISGLVWFWVLFLFFFFSISGLVLTREDFLVVTIKEKCTAVDSFIVDFLGIM